MESCWPCKGYMCTEPSGLLDAASTLTLSLPLGTKREVDDAQPQGRQLSRTREDELWHLEVILLYKSDAHHRLPRRPSCRKNSKLEQSMYSGSLQACWGSVAALSFKARQCPSLLNSTVWEGHVGIDCCTMLKQRALRGSLWGRKLQILSCQTA